MKLTAIKAQIKNANRVSVFVDSKFSFSLSLNQLLEQKLKVGLELDDIKLGELKKLSNDGKLYERVLNYISIRPRSVKEIKDYLWRKKTAPELADKIIDQLVQKSYVNDNKFAKLWVESRRLNKTISVRKLKLELKQKGIADAIIAESINDAGFDEKLGLVELVEKKRRLSRFKSDPKKLTAYLIGQGFRYSDVKEVLKDN